MSWKALFFKKCVFVVRASGNEAELIVDIVQVIGDNDGNDDIGGGGGHFVDLRLFCQNLEFGKSIWGVNFAF